MSGAPDHPLTVRWVLFGFRGRIGRKSFWLGALGMVLIQSIAVLQVISVPEGGPASIVLSLVLLGVWLACAWAALALAVKRLHDIGLPGVLAVLLLIPGVQYFTFLALAVWPSTQQTNEHGPPPFPRDGPST